MRWRCGCYRASCGCCGVTHSDATPLAYCQHPNDMTVHSHTCDRCAEHFGWRRVEPDPYADRGRDAYGFFATDAKCMRERMPS